MKPYAALVGITKHHCQVPEKTTLHKIITYNQDDVAECIILYDCQTGSIFTSQQCNSYYSVLCVILLLIVTRICVFLIAQDELSNGFLIKT